MNNDFKIYKLKEEIDKYSAINNNPDISNNHYNKHKIRDDFRSMLINNLFHTIKILYFLIISMIYTNNFFIYLAMIACMIN